MYLGRGARVPPTMHARRCCGRSVGRRVCRTDGNGFPVSNSRVVEFTRLSRLGNVCGPAGGHDNGGTARRNRADGCRAGVLEPLGHPAIGGLMNCTPLCWPGSRRTIAQRVRMRRGTAVSWRALMVALLALAVSATASAAAVLAPVVSRHGCVSDGTFGCARVRGVSDPVEGGAAISPDGRWLYVPSRRTSAVAVLRLDPVRGTMSQSRSTRGCVAGLHLPPDEGSDAPLRTRGCTPVRGIAMVPKQAVVTPDGRNVYVTATPRYPAEPELDGLDVGIQSVIVLRRLGTAGGWSSPRARPAASRARRSMAARSSRGSARPAFRSVPTECGCTSAGDRS